AQQLQFQPLAPVQCPLFLLDPRCCLLQPLAGVAGPAQLLMGHCQEEPDCRGLFLHGSCLVQAGRRILPAAGPVESSSPATRGQKPTSEPLVTTTGVPVTAL